MSAEPAREPDQLDGVPLPEERVALVGHEHAFSQISQQIAERRLPSGILVHGPRGIGKASFAFALAHRILVETGDEEEERVSQQIAQGSHPNVFVLRRTMNKTGSNFATQIRVEQISQRKDNASDPLISRLHRTRGRGGYRVVIVDAVDDCNQSAANALLKILEEPPAETVFILISHQPGKLLPTIRSRVHSHALRPLSNAQVRQVIDQAPMEGDVDEAIVLANGVPRRAYELLAHGNVETLLALRKWLDMQGMEDKGMHLALADAIVASGAAEQRFARDMISEALTVMAKQAAFEGPGARLRLASATQLWDKAQAMFAEAEIYNLDMRQTLVAIFDAVKQHSRMHSQPPAETQ